MAPLRSVITILPAPVPARSLTTAVPAAPAPEVTIFTSSRRLPTSFRAFFSAARTMTAVPCWSSWKTGMSQRCFSFSSISKQRGAEMSSKFTPPKEPASRATVLTISSTFLLLTQRGMASTPPNSLNRTHLPSMTGIPASGPMSPRPRTAVPSVTTATVFQRRVRVKLLLISF